MVDEYLRYRSPEDGCLLQIPDLIAAAGIEPRNWSLVVAVTLALRSRARRQMIQLAM